MSSARVDPRQRRPCRATCGGFPVHLAGTSRTPTPSGDIAGRGFSPRRPNRRSPDGASPAYAEGALSFGLPSPPRMNGATESPWNETGLAGPAKVGWAIKNPQNILHPFNNFTLFRYANGLRFALRQWITLLHYANGLRFALRRWITLLHYAIPLRESDTQTQY